MPNWVFNHLAVTGASKHLAAFVDRVRSVSVSDESAVLDFDTIVPIPAEMRDNQEVDPDSPQGFPKWRTWAVENWGTKWNARATEFEGDPEAGSVAYTFRTAWSPPDAWIAAASDAFPSLEFTHEYVAEMAESGGRGRWRAGVVIDHHDLDADEIEWLGDGEDEAYPSVEPSTDDGGEPLDEGAIQWAGWLVESVIGLGMNSQRARRSSSENQTWIAAVTEHIGAEARCARLIAAARTAYDHTPEQARDPAGHELLRQFTENLVLAAAEAIHAAAEFRLHHEGGIDREARDKELAHALEVAAEDGSDATRTGRTPLDWLLHIVTWLGEATDAVAIAERAERGHEPPAWVTLDHQSAADAARHMFGLLAIACIEAIAVLGPEDLEPDHIEQPSFWDEIRQAPNEEQP